MLIRLTESQQKQLQAILASAQIRGSDAPTIIGLAQALSRPVPEPKEEKKEDKDGPKR